MDKLLLRPDEAAQLLGIGRSKIYEMLATRELPSLRMGHSVRIPLQALQRWVTNRTLVADQQCCTAAEDGAQ